MKKKLCTLRQSFDQCKMSYKKCFVLSCLNNSNQNPDKRFIYVPTNKEIREQWCEAVDRPKGSIKQRTPAYCCIDHFNIDDDFEDPVDNKPPKLKSGVIPCLKFLDISVEEIVSFSSHVSSLSKSSKESSSQSSKNYSDWTPSSIEISDYDSEDSEDETVPVDVNKSLLDERQERQEFAEQRQNLLLKTELVKNVYGIELSKMYLVDIIAEETNITKKNILLCLEKIKLNLSFALIAFDYALSPGHCSRIFNRTVTAMAEALKKFVVWSDNKVVEHRLPIAFRANYMDVVSIIDCFEIQIQKPSNPVHQSHTWSQYKGCNTVKYLVSSTPDGIVNFISEGYGGRISDLEIVKASGYLDVLPRNSVVMADRGFKSIESLLQAKNCRLVRPPSVATGENLSKEEVRLTKQVAALRIHIERVIRRYRDFNFLLPHATINLSLLSSVDEVVKVVSAVINIQNALIK